MAKTVQGVGDNLPDSEVPPKPTFGVGSSPPKGSLPPARPEELVGTVLSDTYEIVKPLAQGGMGTVYEARHLRLQRRFAVKVLSNMGKGLDSDLVRFQREAKLASAIGHENIIDVIDVDQTDEGWWYIVMELLEGENLRQRICRKKRLPVPEVVALAKQLGSALDAAHGSNVVHRDVKPENIFLLERPDSTLTVKLLDFGISKVRDTDPSLTTPGDLIGTLSYMSPEQAQGESASDHRTDLFALGVVFYETLTGTVPFDGETAHAIVCAILAGAPPSPRKYNRDLSEDLCQVLLRALAKDPDDRYQSGEALAKALGHAAGVTEPPLPTKTTPPPTRSGLQPIHLVLAFVLGIILCGLAAWLFLR